jgi:hypothetical protein
VAEGLAGSEDSVTHPIKTVLKPGTRVYHRVFKHMSGEVVKGDGHGHYQVRVDPEIGHFSEFIWIMPNEIVVEKPRRRKAT